MLVRLVQSLRRNIVAYLALFLALGAGGGYAIAATNAKSIHGCVDGRTHLLYIQKRCHRGQMRLVWSQSQPGTVVAWASVAANGFIGTARGISVQHIATGTYNVTATPPACSQVGVAPTVTVDTGPPSAISPPGAFPVAWETFNRNKFVVYTGVVQGGVFTPADEAFNVQVPCS